MKYKTMLDPGHGGRVAGASTEVVYTLPVETEEGIEWVEKKKTLLEKDITLRAMRACGNHLRTYSPEVYPYFTRNSDIHMTLGERCLKAVEFDCHSFISFHCNSYADKSVSGFEVFYHFDVANPLADIIHYWLKSSLPDHKDRGVKEANYYVIGEDRKTGEPHGIKNAVLVEFEFMSHPVVGKWLSQEPTQDLFGVIVADALRDYYLC